MKTSTRKHRFAAGMAGVAGIAGLSLVAAACGADAGQPVATGVVATDDGDTANILTVSAAEGATARAARDSALGGTSRLASAESVAGVVAGVAADALPIDCGTGGEPYVPTAEEIAAANADSDALAVVLDTYGVTYERIVDDLGFAYIETDYADAVAQSVVASFWNDRYPPQPIPAEEIERIRAENDAIAAALDAVGASYTRQSDDSGWEWIEWDYENVAAQEAVNAVYAELYPPVPPAPEELERMRTENDALAAAFDAAGIAYTRVADEAGWEWIEWDYEDAAVAEAVQAVFDDLYPVEPGDGGIEPCLAIDDSLVRGGVASENDGPGTVEILPAEVGVASENDGPGTVEILPAEGGVASDNDGPGTVEILPVEGVAVGVDLEPVPVEGDVAVGSGGTDEISADEISIAPDSGFTDAQIAQRDAELAAMVTGFEAAGVEHEVVGESPWTTVVFDLDATGAVQVIAEILAARG